MTVATMNLCEAIITVFDLKEQHRRSMCFQLNVMESSINFRHRRIVARGQRKEEEQQYSASDPTLAEQDKLHCIVLLKRVACVFEAILLDGKQVRSRRNWNT